MKHLKYILIILFFTPMLCSSQIEHNVWTFGYYGAFRFDTLGNEAIPYFYNEKLISKESCASICDSTGKLLFYSDGVNVWNYEHDNLGTVGSITTKDSTQGATIVPDPAAYGVYYLFLINPGFYYYKIDFRNHEKGKITSGPHEIYRFLQGRVEAVVHDNDKDFWVIFNFMGKGDKPHKYAVYSITSEGFNHRYTHIATGNLDRESNHGYLRASADGRFICSVNNDSSEFEVARFDNKTGKIFDIRSFSNSNFEDGLYGAEFSPNSRFLYLTLNKRIDTLQTITKLYQVDVNKLFFQNRLHMILIDGWSYTWEESGMWSLLLARNDKIYSAIMGRNYVATINDPNKRGHDCNFEEVGDYVSVAGYSSRKGLPNNYKHRDAEPLIIKEYYKCIGDSVYFENPTDTTGGDFVWTKDGEEWDSLDFEIKNIELSDSGTYYYIDKDNERVHVILSLYVNDPSNFKLIAEPDNICKMDTVKITCSREFESYLWSTGETTRSIIVEEPGRYTVKVTDTLGCTAEKTINIRLMKPEEFEIVRSGDGCDELITLSSDKELNEYEWSTGETTRSIKIDEPGTYYLTGYTSETCFYTDTIKIDSVRTIPLDIEFEKGKFICKEDSINVRILNPLEGIVYRWSNGDNELETYFTEAGTHYIIAEDTATGCERKIEFELESYKSIDLTILEETICEYSATKLTSSYTKENIKYQWSNGSTDSSTEVFTPGTYYLTITTENGCKISDTIEVEEIGEVHTEITAYPDRVSCDVNEIILKASTKSEANILLSQWSNGSREDSIIVTESGTYTIEVRNANGCFAYDTINVEIIEPFDVSIESNKGDTVCNGEQVLLSLNGLESLSNYEFNWSNGSNNPSIAVKEAGEYSVVVSYKGSDCKDSASFNLHTLPSPEFEITGNTEICEGQSTELFIDGYSDDIDYTWSNNSNEQSIIVDKPGEYWVKAENSIGCASFDTIRVEEFELPEVEISGNFVLCEGDTATISTDKEYAEYKWSNGATTREIKVTEAGEYFVEVTNENGCSTVSEPATVEVNSIDFSLESDLYDFGKVYRSESRDTTIYLYNNSDEPITVVIDGKEEVIESGEFPIPYSLDNSTTGEKQDYITIKIVEPCEAEYQVEIRAEVYAKVTLSTIDVHTEIGEYETIPFYIESESNLEDKEFEVTTHIDEDLFFTNDSYTVSGNMNISPNQMEFHSITGQILLAENKLYEITFPEINFSDEYIEWDTLNGTITFDLICLHDLRVIHVAQPTKISTSPNPVDDILNIDISTGEEGNFNLELYSSEGRKVYSNNWNQSGDSKELHIDSKQIPSGVYQLRLRTEGHLYKKQVVIVK